jgi:hypothetical protein
MMKKIVLIIFGIFLLLSCQEKIAELIFDKSKISNIKQYSYIYNLEKLITCKENEYTLFGGLVVDTMITITDCIYNEKGLLIEEISQNDFEEKPSFKIYKYNVNDSLICELTISEIGDTTYWIEYDYYFGKREITYKRNLLIHIDENLGNIQQLENQYDTTIYKYYYEYENNLCKTQKELDKKNNLIKTIVYEYENETIKLEKQYKYDDIFEKLEKTKYYDYSKSNIFPDYYSLDNKNDTVEACIYKFDKNEISTKTDLFDYGTIVIVSYFENGLLVREICIDKKMKLQFFESFEYFENGKMKESYEYHEPINHSKNL